LPFGEAAESRDQFAFGEISGSAEYHYYAGFCRPFYLKPFAERIDQNIRRSHEHLNNENLLLLRSGFSTSDHEQCVGRWSFRKLPA
jgi:hypothetical protein